MRYTLDDLNRAHEADSRARTFVEYARGLAAEGHTTGALGYLAQQFGANSPHLERVKAAVPAATTGNAPGLASERLGAAFLELTRRRSVLGRLVGTRPAPFNTRVPIVSTGTVAGWFQQGGPMPATAMALDVAALPPTTIGTLLAVSRELMRSGSPEATALLERDLQRAVVDMEDGSLLDDQVAVVDTRPAGLLAGLSAISTSSPASLAEDVEALFGAVRDANPDRPFFITSPRGGMFLALATDASGARLFPDARAVDDGSLAGVPLLIAKAAGTRLICVDAADLAVADGGITLASSDVAAVQQDDAPSAGPANVVSAFQTDTTFLRITRTLHWVLGHEDGCAFLELPVGSPA